MDFYQFIRYMYHILRYLYDRLHSQSQTKRAHARLSFAAFASKLLSTLAAAAAFLFFVSEIEVIHHRPLLLPLTRINK